MSDKGGPEWCPWGKPIQLYTIVCRKALSPLRKIMVRTGNMNLTGNVTFQRQGRFTIAVVRWVPIQKTVTDTRVAVGVAHCSIEDRFLTGRGQYIAFRRALRSLGS